MTLYLHEIAETNHRILNPFTEDKLMLLGEICHLKPGMRQLDLACGKGEMLCQWARHWGIHGIGVDISKVFLMAAHQRAEELGVVDQVTFMASDASQYVAEARSFDIVSCIGATWIGNGLAGTLQLMLPGVKDGGLVLVGEPYWIDEPPDEAYEGTNIRKDDFTSLKGTLDRIESVGLELVEMVAANTDTCDRYVASQWWTLSEWLHSNPSDPRAFAVREMLIRDRRNYLQYERRYLGWGVFVLKAK
ncbi:MAG: methyltransferase domain-containing protein [Chloroflexi bacterium]|nr:methyltransferase domain-containing protein [Chloroflexota bacterium]